MFVYLPRTDEYPDADSAPNVIDIEGICYEKIGLSKELPDTLWHQVFAEYEDCEDCNFKSVVYDLCPSPCVLLGDCTQFLNNYILTVSGFDGNCSSFNGVFSLVRGGVEAGKYDDCEWTNGQWSLYCSDGGVGHETDPGYWILSNETANGKIGISSGPTGVFQLLNNSTDPTCTTNGIGIVSI